MVPQKLQPGLPRPVAARKVFEFNKTVGADHFTHTFATKPYDFLNVLCWGTVKMMVGSPPNKLARDTRQRLMNLWVKPFGLMEVLVVDQGPEFVRGQVPRAELFVAPCARPEQARRVATHKTRRELRRRVWRWCRYRTPPSWRTSAALKHALRARVEVRVRGQNGAAATHIGAHV